MYGMIYCSFLHGGGDSDEEEGGGGEVADKLQVSGNETINVFSIASGHLYERFLRYVHVGGA